MLLSQVAFLLCVVEGGVTKSTCFFQLQNATEPTVVNEYVFYWMLFEISLQKYVFRLMCLLKVATLLGVFEGRVTTHMCFFQPQDAAEPTVVNKYVFYFVFLEICLQT